MMCQQVNTVRLFIQHVHFVFKAKRLTTQLDC